MSNPSDSPLLHPPFFVIPGVDPNSPISAQTEQIDQLNTLLLQDIDANFARFHQIITSKVLPQIKRFAIASEPTREAAQFWRAFFETASAVRLSQQGDTTVNSHSGDTSTQYDDQTLALRREADESSIRGEGSFMFDPPPGVSSTPLPAGRGVGGRPNDSWEDSMESPFDKVDRQLRDELRIRKSGYDDQSSSDMPTPSLPSGYDLPGMLGKDLSDLSSMHGDYSTGTVDPSCISGSPTRSQTHRDPDPHQSQPLRYSIQASPTPKANRLAHPPPSDANPFGAKFSGIADLRSTPLNPNRGKGKGRAFKPKTSIIPGLDLDSDSDSDGELPMGMSPPVTMNFTLPPRAQAMMEVAMAQTPAKVKAKGKAVEIGEHGSAGSKPTGSSEAGVGTGSGASPDSSAVKGKEKEAKHILDDLLEEMGSEMSPRVDTPEAFRRYSVAPGDLPAGKLLFSDSTRSVRTAGIEEEQSDTLHALSSSYQSSHHSQGSFHSHHAVDDDTFHAPPSHHSYQPSAPPSYQSYQSPHPSYPRQSLADTSYNSSPDVPPSHAHPLSGQAPIYSEESFDADDTFDTSADISSFQVPSSVGSGHPGFAQPGHPGQGQYQGYQGGSGAAGAQGYAPPYGQIQGDESYVSSEGDVTDTSLFGGRGGRNPGEGFNLMRQDEINTYYGGGKLEDASLSQSPSEGLAKGRGGGI